MILLLSLYLGGGLRVGISDITVVTVLGVKHDALYVQLPVLPRLFVEQLPQEVLNLLQRIGFQRHRRQLGFPVRRLPLLGSAISKRARFDLTK